MLFSTILNYLCLLFTTPLIIVPRWHGVKRVSSFYITIFYGVALMMTSLYAIEIFLLRNSHAFDTEFTPLLFLALLWGSIGVYTASIRCNASLYLITAIFEFGRWLYMINLQPSPYHPAGQWMGLLRFLTLSVLVLDYRHRRPLSNEEAQPLLRDPVGNQQSQHISFKILLTMVRSANRNHWRLFMATVVIKVVSASIPGILVIYTKKYFESLGTSPGGLSSLFLIYAIVRLSNRIFPALAQYSAGDLARQTRTQISLDAYQHLFKQSSDYLLISSPVQSQTAIRQGQGAILVLQATLLDAASPIASLFSFGNILNEENPYLLHLACTTAVLYIWVITIFARRSISLQRDINQKESKLSKVNYDLVRNWLLFLSEHTFRHELRRIKTSQEDHNHARHNQATLTFWEIICQDVLLELSELGAICLCHQEESIFLMISYWGTIFFSLTTIASKYENICKALVDIEGLHALFTTQPSIKVKPNAADIRAIDRCIKFENVSVTSPRGVRILHDMTFTINKGQKVAIIGPSGSGKSTLLGLFIRLRDPSSGTIKIDDQETTDITISSLRKLFSYVLQDSPLLDRKINENIVYGSFETSDEETYKAGRQALIHEDIQGWQDGYSTEVSQCVLSGGQRQRISLARGIIKKPAILIFDEPTAALDAASEQAITDTILDRKETVIVATHRLGIARRADKILVVDQGRIVQQGKHDNLCSEDGVYKKLWEATSKLMGMT